MYLYQINYPPQEKEICELELWQLFGCEPDLHVVISEVAYEAGRSVYFKSRLNMIYDDQSLDSLCSTIGNAGLCFEQFKVNYMKTAEDQLSYQQRIDAVRKISGVITGTSAIHEPLIELGVIYFQDRWYFGVLEKDHQSWQKHHCKPQSYSQSLSVRLARSLVNLAAGKDTACQLIDPCCGVGTVVLEGLSMGLNIRGSDVHRGICWKANRNLEYFGYPKIIENRDIADVTDHYDACIIDIPYNLYSHITEIEQQNIIHHSYRIAHRLVLISHEEIAGMLEKAGWHISRQCAVGKMRFCRYVYLCDKNNINNIENKQTL